MRVTVELEGDTLSLYDIYAAAKRVPRAVVLRHALNDWMKSTGMCRLEKVLGAQQPIMIEFAVEKKGKHEKASQATSKREPRGRNRPRVSRQP